MRRAKQPAPRTLCKGGRALWKSITTTLALDDRDRVLLLEACRAKDRCDALATVIEAAGPVLPDGRVQPALIEARQQQQALGRVLTAMRLPADLMDAESGRPQRRGMRGTYHPRLTVVEREAL